MSHLIVINNGCFSSFPEYILCSSNTSNIVKDLISIRNSLDEDQRHFIQFTLKSNIEELPENMFIDFTFKKICINSALNLRKIHKNSFNSTTEMTDTYEHLGYLPTKLVNSPPDYDLYAALSSLVNVKYININLEWNASHEIPDYAFRVINGKQNRLKSIIFKGQFNISRIGNYAFYPIANLSQILMSSIPIGFINAHAFDFEDSFNNNLTINLFNTSLTENSFEAAIFTNSKRPLNVNLGNYL